MLTFDLKIACTEMINAARNKSKNGGEKKKNFFFKLISWKNEEQMKAGQVFSKCLIQVGICKKLLVSI